MKRRGFTVVELIITITIMGILLTLAVVNLSSTQANARDAERASDVQSIANHLEIFYKNGSTASASTSVGRYPSIELLATGETSVKAFLPDIDALSATAPDSSTVADSFIPATNSTQTEAGVLPQPTKSQYVYQPIKTDGTLCTTEAEECRKFVIYYRLEVTDTVKKLMSKNQ
ncbi:MAG: type II secretion system protein [Candidatus Microsaccharimonas sp.]